VNEKQIQMPSSLLTEVAVTTKQLLLHIPPSYWQHMCHINELCYYKENKGQIKCEHNIFAASLLHFFMLCIPSLSSVSLRTAENNFTYIM